MGNRPCASGLEATSGIDLGVDRGRGPRSDPTSRADPIGSQAHRCFDCIRSPHSEERRGRNLEYADGSPAPSISSARSGFRAPLASFWLTRRPVHQTEIDVVQPQLLEAGIEGCATDRIGRQLPCQIFRRDVELRHAAREVAASLGDAPRCPTFSRYRCGQSPY